MGYYSSIGITINESSIKNFIDNLKDQIKELNDENDNIKNEIRNLIKDNSFYSKPNKAGDLLIYIEYIKWYDDDPVVESIMRSLKNIKFENYLYIRLGESPDDIEELGSYYDNEFNMDWIKQIIFEPKLEDEEASKTLDIFDD